jgi:hypothetical protein
MKWLKLVEISSCFYEWSPSCFNHLATGHFVWFSNGLLSNTVTHRIPNRPIFEWPFFGHFLYPVFQWKKQDGDHNLDAILFLPFENQTGHF